MRNNRLKDKILREVFDYISCINKEAYKDIYLLSNEVLSKNPLSNSFFNNYVERKNIKSIRIHQIIFKITLYYLKSIILYIVYIFHKIIFLISNQYFDIEKIENEIILIDIIYLMNKPILNNEYEYEYFNNIENVLDKRSILYAYLPTFYSNYSPIKLYKILKEIKNRKLPVLTEYQLVSFYQLAKVLLFILFYPFHVLRLTKNLKNNSTKDKYLVNSLLNSLDDVTFHSFICYLKGLALSSSHLKRIKIISKYENQAIDKNYYKGLKTGGNYVFIYGCQLFIYPFSLLNINSDPNEIVHDIVPDKIIVNGKYYLYNDNRLNSIVGPSFRYKYIITNNYRWDKRETLLVLLPYLDYECANILKIINNINYDKNNIIVKFHPTTSIKKFIKYVPNNISISTDSLFELLVKSKIVIGSQSGTLIEAISLAIPVIIIKNKNEYLHNPMPDLGKGIVWDTAGSSDEVNKLINKFENPLHTDKINLINYSKQYKNMFFCNPTEEKIIEVFNL